MNYFGPQPTKEEWKVWCRQNQELWEKTDIWIKDYKQDPYKILTNLIKGN